MFPNLVPSQQSDASQVLPASYDASKSLRTPQVEVSARKKEDGPNPEELADKELLDEAHERFRKCAEYESAWRKRAVEELNFVDGLDHWTAEQRQERAGRPCLTFDRIGPSLDQVINNMRQSPPEPRISPVGNGADKDEAEIIQGLLRNIEQDSGAEVAYTTAYEHAVKIGRGWWREYFDWESSDTANVEDEAGVNLSPELFHQKLVVKRIANPFSVYPDPASEEFDYGDMRYCFVTEDIDREIFEEEHPDNTKTLAISGSTFEGVSDQIRDDWFPKGAIRRAEYWKVITTPVKILMLSNGVVCRAGDEPKAENGFDVPTVIGRRTVQRRKVLGAKITGAEILEQWEWKGKWIPLIGVIGREGIHNAKRVLRGMIRSAMDANLSYDYMASKEAEAIGLAPISQWLTAAGAVDGFEKVWADANRKAVTNLPWNHVDADGQPIPQPSRVNAEPAVAAISNALAHRDNDVKSSLSTWDPNLGSPGPEQSGRAINLRQKQSDNAHFHYADNLARSIRHATRVRLDLIRHVYSEERVITITDPDATVRSVQINKETLIKGVQKLFRLGSDFNPARYDVTIGTGPSYASRKSQQTDAVMQMLQSSPQAMSRALDLVAQMIDLPPEFCDRLRPPDVQAKQDENAPAVPPQFQAKYQQLEQLAKQLSEELQKTSHVLETKQIERESQERMSLRSDIASIVRAEIASKSAEAQLLVRNDHDSVKSTLDHSLASLDRAQRAEELAQQAREQPQPPGNAPAAAPESAPAPAEPEAPPVAA
jgi:hypothetical protein